MCLLDLLLPRGILLTGEPDAVVTGNYGTVCKQHSPNTKRFDLIDFKSECCFLSKFRLGEFENILKGGFDYDGNQSVRRRF